MGERGETWAMEVGTALVPLGVPADETSAFGDGPGAAEAGRGGASRGAEVSWGAVGEGMMKSSS